MILFLLLLLAGTVTGQPSPAERAMLDARRAIASRPSKPDGYNALAMALARRARETSDDRLYDEAAKAVEQSLSLERDNIGARKTQAWLLLGKHQFEDALRVARELKSRVPRDATIYGLIADACAELGKYQEAEQAVQTMLDLGHSSVPGLTRAAYLREVFGDIEGALDLMASAYAKLDSSMTEDRAWVLTHAAHLRLLTGSLEEAEGLLAEALSTFPNYHYALKYLAALRTMQSRYPEAADLLRQRYESAPHPENLYDLALALKRAGQDQDAEKAFSEFELTARKESERADNANRELIFYYADYAEQTQLAAELARKELARRRDVQTLHAAAWAFYCDGKHADAYRDIETVLKIGVRDPVIFYHAGLIAAAAGDKTAADRYLKESLKLNRRSEVARLAASRVP